MLELLLDFSTRQWRGRYFVV